VTADAETRAEVLAGVREVLAALKARAAEPPRAVTYPETVSWDAPATPTPLADFAAVAKLGADPPPSVLQLLERLTYLLGLSDLEREFFEACASDELLDAFDGRLAYADWLEDRACNEGALAVRKLTPRPGDVLVFHPPRDARGVEGWVETARNLQDSLAARGLETSWMVLPPGAALGQLSEAQMADLGWVPAGKVAQEREACAAVAEGGGCPLTADRIRARREDKAG
jgi:hypothetical protein